MKKIVVTGANGAGKTHFANRLSVARPDVPLTCFDAIKLQTNWHQRPRLEIDNELAKIIETDAWIIEGGPSMLHLAAGQADALVWLDPPETIRAWQLALRPWKFFGQTRPELPDGNRDWPLQQYKFALRSLKNKMKFQKAIAEVFDSLTISNKWHCRTEKERVAAIEKWANASMVERV